MEIGKAFGFVTEDEQWITKVLIGGLILVIPFLGVIAVLGYSYRVAQNVARGNPRPLPAWGEFGDFLGRGFMGLIIGIVYLLPVIVIYGVFVFLTVAGAAAAGESEAGAGVVGLLGLCLIPLIFIAALVCSFASLAAIMRYLATDSLGEAFKFGEVIATLRSHIGAFLMLIGVNILAFLAVILLGGITCTIGAPFVGFYGQCVIGHAIGQVMQRIFPPQQPVYAAPGYYGPPPGYGPPPSY